MFAQFLDVRLVEGTFLMQDLGNDAFRTKDRHHIFLAELIRFHQRAKDFDRRSIRNRMMLFSTQTRVPASHQNKEDLMNTTTVSSSCLPGLPEHSGNCLRHSHANSPIALPVQTDSEDLSADLLPELSEFSAGTDIRQFLARLLTLVTKGRISPPAAPPSSPTSPTNSSTPTAPSPSKPMPWKRSLRRSSSICPAHIATGPTSNPEAPSSKEPS